MAYLNYHNLSAGQSVQHVERYPNRVRDGVIVTLTPAKRAEEREYWKLSEQEQDDMCDHATVKWSDGEVSEMVADDLQKRDSTLEREFRMHAYEGQKLIDQKMAEADAAIGAACKLAEQYGLSFSACVSPLSQTFKVPILEKYEELDSEFLEGIVDASGEYEGWQHSAVCW